MSLPLGGGDDPLLDVNLSSRGGGSGGGAEAELRAMDLLGQDYAPLAYSGDPVAGAAGAGGRPAQLDPTSGQTTALYYGGDRRGDAVPPDMMRTLQGLGAMGPASGQHSSVGFGGEDAGSVKSESTTTRAQSASGMDQIDWEKRQRRLEKNREIARKCRQRKRDRMNWLEKEVTRLSEKCSDLQAQLARTQSEEDKEAARVQLIERMRAMVEQGASEEEIRKLTDDYYDNFSDFGRARKAALLHHAEQLKYLLLPTQVTKMCLWSLHQDDEFFDEKRNAMYGGGIWNMICDELNLSPSQKQAVLSCRETVGEQRRNVAEAVAIAEELEKKVEGNVAAMGWQMKTILSVLKPSQQARFLIWIENNEAMMSMLNNLWNAMSHQMELQAARQTVSQSLAGLCFPAVPAVAARSKGVASSAGQEAQGGGAARATMAHAPAPAPSPAPAPVHAPMHAPMHAPGHVHGTPAFQESSSYQQPHQHAPTREGSAAAEAAAAAAAAAAARSRYSGYSGHAGAGFPFHEQPRPNTNTRPAASEGVAQDPHFLSPASLAPPAARDGSVGGATPAAAGSGGKIPGAGGAPEQSPAPRGGAAAGVGPLPPPIPRPPVPTDTPSPLLENPGAAAHAANPVGAGQPTPGGAAAQPAAAGTPGPAGGGGGGAQGLAAALQGGLPLAALQQPLGAGSGLASQLGGGAPTGGAGQPMAAAAMAAIGSMAANPQLAQALGPLLAHLFQQGASASAPLAAGQQQQMQQQAQQAQQAQQQVQQQAQQQLQQHAPQEQHYQHQHQHHEQPQRPPQRTRQRGDVEEAAVEEELPPGKRRPVATSTSGGSPFRQAPSHQSSGPAL